MKLTKRGERVFATLLVIAGVALLIGVYQVIGNLWWTGSGYCWGSMVECMEGKL